MDILKLVMAFLVVGIHAEPFGFNFWLDKGFGVLTRLCVPFFFVASAYFYWRNDRGFWAYLKRILSLYFVWSVIYLPFDVGSLSEMTPAEIAVRYLWAGNKHALWYLCATAIGFALTWLLLKVFSRRQVLFLSIAMLAVGCAKSTWAPLWRELFSWQATDWLGSRNGLFYAFPYIAMGMFVATSPSRGLGIPKKKHLAGFLLSLVALVAESALFVVKLKTDCTNLWLSVFPCAYCFFMLALNVDIPLDKQTALFLRKTSTLVYVCHGLFLMAFRRFDHVPYFALVALCAFLMAAIVVKASGTPRLRWLKCLY